MAIARQCRISAFSQRPEQSFDDVWQARFASGARPGSNYAKPDGEGVLGREVGSYVVGPGFLILVMPCPGSSDVTKVFGFFLIANASKNEAFAVFAIIASGDFTQGVKTVFVIASERVNFERKFKLVHNLKGLSHFALVGLEFRVLSQVVARVAVASADEIPSSVVLDADWNPLVDGPEPEAVSAMEVVVSYRQPVGFGVVPEDFWFIFHSLFFRTRLQILLGCSPGLRLGRQTGCGSCKSSTRPVRRSIANSPIQPRACVAPASRPGSKPGFFPKLLLLRRAALLSLLGFDNVKVSYFFFALLSRVAVSLSSPLWSRVSNHFPPEKESKKHDSPGQPPSWAGVIFDSLNGGM